MCETGVCDRTDGKGLDFFSRMGYDVGDLQKEQTFHRTRKKTVREEDRRRQNG